MKMKYAITLLAAAFPTGSASPPTESVDAVGQWLNDRVMRAAELDSEVGARGLDEGVYRLIPLAELDAPEPVKDYFREQIRRSRSGVEKVERDSIPSLEALFNAVPKTQRSNAILRQRLPNPPSTLQGTLLGAAEVIGMEPTGAIDGVKSSGLSRFFRLGGIGIVEFNEENFRVPGGVIEAFVEAQNTEIKGVPGQLDMSMDDQGRGQVVLVWAGKDKLYKLIATGNDDVQRKADVLKEIARSIVD
ncbi:hypothetical protein [uncultured Stenotrophomonas sp.]|uniref:hypothetical protein n=1 Tax=uncultured Stenotrophomonas sp. TaxID=165438 RepID=UPI0028D2A6EC|nr:hypothetical protein [uncultured Stenotrophomonas sp.]